MGIAAAAQTFKKRTGRHGFGRYAGVRKRVGGEASHP